jgi:hypothetical protein
MVVRVLSIPEDVEITDLHDVFLSMLGWQHDLGFIIRVHGHEVNSYQRLSVANGSASFSCGAKRNSCTSARRWISGNGRSEC